MKKVLLPVLILLLAPSVWNECFNQSKKNIPKNFFGLFGGVELNTTSILGGIEYQAILWTKNKLNIGIKGLHIFKYDNGNMILYMGSDDGSSSFSAVMPTAQYFTSRKHKASTGFFLHSALGIGWRHESHGAQSRPSLASFETGFGWQCDLGSSTHLKLTNAVLFAGQGGIATVKLSLGL